MKGLVLKNQNGYFTVVGESGISIRCRSRGVLKRKTDILVGDYVEFELGHQDGEGVISKVYERKNQLYRPPIANVDELVLVSAICTPDLNQFLLDKMIILAELADMNPVICINKCELNHEAAEAAADSYRDAGYSCIRTSTYTKEGLEELESMLTGEIIAFSGPSGAGKSSLLNYLIGNRHFASGEVSLRTGRGRTTTKHAELIRFKEQSFLMDTPGYTLLEINALKEEQAGVLFREFHPYLGKCKFNNCVHVSEPGCAVRQAVSVGHIQQRRYESYLKILQEVRNIRKY